MAKVVSAKIRKQRGCGKNRKTGELEAKAKTARANTQILAAPG
jgi:hypothetical protein